MIVIEPMAGLCNRMRAIGSAINLSRKLNRPLYIFWVMTSEINCKFSDLFIIPKDIAGIYECYRGFRTKVVKGASKIFFSFPGNVFLDYKQINSIIDKSGDFTIYKNKKNIYFNTHSDLCENENPYKHFKLAKPIQSIVDRFETSKLIGLHIRRGDHAQNLVYKMHSPLHLFYEEIDRQIAIDNEAKFFVSTDDSKLDDELISKYSDRIVMYPKKSRDRNSPDAIKDAAIDLYCLANCKEIIGTYWSTFTTAAWSINGIPRKVIRKEENNAI